MRPRANRVPLELAVSFRELPLTGRWHAGRTVNISQTGVLFRSPGAGRELSVGTPLEFVLLLSANGGAEDATGVAHCTGRIVRQDDSQSTGGIVATIDEYQLTRVPAISSSTRWTDSFIDRVASTATSPIDVDLNIPDIELAIGLDVPVLISGGDRTARRIAAELVHSRGIRRLSPFVHFRCDDDRQLDEGGGWRRTLARAAGGTLFLDDVDVMPSSMQQELLQFLTTTHSDVRIIAGANRSLHARVAGGSFAPPLYYRLNVIHLECVMVGATVA